MDHTQHPAEQTDTRSNQEPATEKAISRAIGEELRRAREAKGWSRGRLVSRLPSGIGERTLLSYEHGTRHLTVLRFLELCRPLDTPPSTLLTQALQRARIELATLALHVDLRALMNEGNDKFRPMFQWARNKLNKHPEGFVELAPSSVEELADFAGYTYRELANYLARFTPELSAANDTDIADTSAGQECN